MSIIRRLLGLPHRNPHPGTGGAPAPHLDRLDDLARGIADAEVRLLEIATRVAAGRGEPGDESRLRIQREIIAKYRGCLARSAMPTGTADDVEAWLRSITPRTADGTREADPH